MIKWRLNNCFKWYQRRYITTRYIVFGGTYYEVVPSMGVPTPFSVPARNCFYLPWSSQLAEPLRVANWKSIKHSHGHSQLLFCSHGNWRLFNKMLGYFLCTEPPVDKLLNYGTWTIWYRLLNSCHFFYSVKQGNIQENMIKSKRILSWWWRAVKMMAE